MIPFIESAKDEILAKINTLKTTIDRLISSSQDSNPNIALGNLSNKIDTLKQNVDTKAKQETVNKVGQTLENIGSILSNKVDKVEKVINTKASQSSVTEVWEELNNKSNTITSRLGTIEGKVDTKASHEIAVETWQDVNKVMDIVKRGAVKRVQRGETESTSHTLSWNDTTYDYRNGRRMTYKDIKIPYAVKPEKSVLLVSVGGIVSKYNSATYFAHQLINATTIRIYKPTSDESQWEYPIITWQVIEYY